ncbi:MAG TPA: histidine kinase dimerization/phospho-acceptor domain-containing protein, partial [Acidobacteriota bacterium]|nr:histidine kinase dimerization/phospho-acceptor domain-containing protein [Acidobacteriota bacterium]
MSDSQEAKIETVSGRWRPEPAQQDGITLATDRIAHDFNNLLSVIISNLDLLERRIDTSEPSYRWVDRSLRAALRCAEYTDELLSYSRKHSLNSTSLSVNDLIKASVSGLNNRDALNVETSLQPSLWTTQINPEDFCESLKALISNGTEATDLKGRVIITTDNISTGLVGRQLPLDVPPGEYIVVQVVDDGIGMDEEVLGRAVDPFFSTKSSTHHSGMGLSRVYGFVRRS